MGTNDHPGVDTGIKQFYLFLNSIFLIAGEDLAGGAAHPGRRLQLHTRDDQQGEEETLS